MKEIQATVYKNTGLRKSNDDVWGLTPAQCRKVKEVGQRKVRKLATEAR